MQKTLPGSVAAIVNAHGRLWKDWPSWAHAGGENWWSEGCVLLA